MSAEFDALRARFRTQAQTEAPRKARKRREAKRVASVDGRSLRAKGRTAQLNCRVRPELRDRLRRYCETTGTQLADNIERALEAYLEHEGAEP